MNNLQDSTTSFIHCLTVRQKTTSKQHYIMRINLLMFYQDDPKKCTAAKLIKFGLAKKITKSKSKTALLHPYAEKTLLNHEKSSFNSITGIDCSWTLAEKVFQENFIGVSRKLPPLLAGNPINYSKINKLTTVEAIAGAAYILGDELLAQKLLEKIQLGPYIFGLE